MAGPPPLLLRRRDIILPRQFLPRIWVRRPPAALAAQTAAAAGEEEEEEEEDGQPSWLSPPGMYARRTRHEEGGSHCVGVARFLQSVYIIGSLNAIDRRTRTGGVQRRRRMA